ncbi:hypothetical protein [Peribacillus muralis]|uniref:hypothetical protein n=1 Tax=Peribacillus muralis TaxID=264697 RepID=UPI003CFCE029
MEDFYKTRKNEISSNSFKCERGNLSTHIIPVIGSMKLAHIKPLHIQQLVNGLVEKDLSPATVKKIYNSVKSSFNKAVTLELLLKNPTEGVTLPKLSKSELKVG